MKPPKPVIVKLFNTLFLLLKIPGIIVSVLLFCIITVCKFKFKIDNIVSYAMGIMLDSKSPETKKVSRNLGIATGIFSIAFWGLIIKIYFL